VTDFKSEIRESDLVALSTKAASGSYGKYLERIVLKKVRGFTDRDVTFDFPVTALVGPNGGGKTTILGSAALIYRDVAPRTFFAKSGKYDESMKDWAIEYDLCERDLNSRIQIQRTASFKQLKWNRKAVNRKVLIFGVSRTVPATERRELTKAVGSKFAAKREVELDAAVIIGKILGKPIEGYNRLQVDEIGRVSLLCGAQSRRQRVLRIPFRGRRGQRHPHRLRDRGGRRPVAHPDRGNRERPPPGRDSPSGSSPPLDEAASSPDTVASTRSGTR
jgi:energy-coupling factor transporter ATP-binding protein EcfA2